MRHRIATLAVGAAVMAGCGMKTPDSDPDGLGQRTVSILEGTVIGARSVQLLVDSCQADLSTTVSESADRVSVEVEASGGSAVSDCIDSTVVDLDAPLADRELVDGSNGRAVPVEQ